MVKVEAKALDAKEEEKALGSLVEAKALVAKVVTAATVAASSSRRGSPKVARKAQASTTEGKVVKADSMATVTTVENTGTRGQSAGSLTRRWRRSVAWTIWSRMMVKDPRRRMVEAPTMTFGG